MIAQQQQHLVALLLIGSILISTSNSTHTYGNSNRYNGYSSAGLSEADGFESTSFTTNTNNGFGGPFDGFGSNFGGTSTSFTHSQAYHRLNADQNSRFSAANSQFGGGGPFAGSRFNSGGFGRWRR